MPVLGQALYGRATASRSRCFKWQDHYIVRLSVQGYNSKAQMDILIDALTDRCSDLRA